MNRGDKQAGGSGGPLDPPLLISRRHAAQILGVHPNTITNMFKRRELTRIQVSGSVRVSRLEILRVVEKGTRPPTCAEQRRRPPDRPSG